jgi:hypothetical protein
MPADYPRRVFTRLTSPEGLSIRYEVRPDLSLADLRVMSRAGVRQVQAGIESLSTSTLKGMGKGLTAFGNIRFLMACGASGVTVGWNLLIGTPGEGEDVYAGTLALLPLLRHLPPPTGAFPVEIVRFSRYFDHAGGYGLSLRPHDFCALTYPFDPDSLSRIARRFVDDSMDHDTVNAWLDRLNAGIAGWRARWLNEDGREPARLCLADDPDRPFVHDSRSGDVVRRPLNRIARDLLERLQSPVSVKALAATAGIAQSRVEETISEFLKWELLFREGDRLMSLVTLEDPHGPLESACKGKPNRV